ncbi:LacI family DNA-binding transcriptional regulator [Sphaerimonospora mesophila]|uniref:LacI family DNA-binding transcriptional regulator n=1 Tax=Sphaerimonospora mesophila TaxID=37483 RepID=UPI0006E11FA6
MPSKTGGGRSRSKPAVIEDVAALAGVSAMTVSRVFNSPEIVRAETRARVMAAVRKLDYRPNLAARQLATGRSGVLGVVSLDTTLYGPASTLSAIEQAARQSDYTVSIASLGILDRRSMQEGVERLRRQSVDGAIILAPHEAAVDGLRHLPPTMPVVAVDGRDDIPVPVVMVDQRAGAARVTRHLLSLGHETVWHIAGPAEWIDASSRIDGWRSTLEAEGRPVPEVLSGDWSARSGYRLGKQLAGDRSITAIFVANDPMALGVMRALREAGRSVPDDVSVVGFDDVPEAAYFWPPLTTVRQNFAEVGRQALELLLHRIAIADSDTGAEGGAAENVRRLIEPEIVLRESTAAPR